MSTRNLFGGDDDEVEQTKGAAAGEPRLRAVDRSQVTLAPFDLDGLVSDTHVVRSIWAFVQKLDVSPLLKRIKAVEHGPGRRANDPRLLLALWIYATYRGVASSHELARLCVEDSGFRWICGGVSMNQHSLSDFRSKNAVAFDEILVELLGTLIQAQVLDPKRVALDGMKIRAGAGQASFRREAAIRAALRKARDWVKEAKKNRNDPKKNERKAAAKERAAKEREECLQAALDMLPIAREANTKNKEPEEVRVSTTDPEARVMRMGDGGFRPAYNVEVATDTETRLIVGVAAHNCGSDRSQLIPMLDEVERTTGVVPDEILVDGGFVNFKEFDEADARDVTVYAPVGRDGRKADDDPYARKQTDSEPTAEWRQRMKTDEAKEIYKERAAVAETVNADLKAHRGLDRVAVRGIEKVNSVFLLGALAYNAARLISLGLLGALA